MGFFKESELYLWSRIIGNKMLWPVTFTAINLHIAERFYK